MTQPDNQRIVTYDVLGAQTARIDELTADTGWVTVQASGPTIKYRTVGNRTTVYVYGGVSAPNNSDTTLGSGIIPDRPTQIDTTGVANLSGFAGILSVSTTGDVFVTNSTGATRTTINAKVEYYND